MGKQPSTHELLAAIAEQKHAADILNRRAYLCLGIAAASAFVFPPALATYVGLSALAGLGVAAFYFEARTENNIRELEQKLTAPAGPSPSSTPVKGSAGLQPGPRSPFNAGSVLSSVLHSRFNNQALPQKSRVYQLGSYVMFASMLGMAAVMNSPLLAIGTGVTGLMMSAASRQADAAQLSQKKAQSQPK